MEGIIPIVNHVIDKINLIGREMAASQFDLSAYQRRATRTAFVLADNNFDSALEILTGSQDSRLTAGAFIRSNIENLADIVFFRDNYQQSWQYIELGMNTYANVMRSAFNAPPEEVSKSDLMNQLIFNPWAGHFIKDPETGQTVIDPRTNKPKFRSIKPTDRIKRAHIKGYPNLVAVYGFYCYFTHPNPGVARYRSKRFKDDHDNRVNSMIVDTCVVMIETMRQVIDDWELKSVSTAELDEILNQTPKIGVMHHFVYGNPYPIDAQLQMLMHAEYPPEFAEQKRKLFSV